jgi:hypothetical protein
METRLLYNVAAHLSTVIIWDHDWIHFGTGKDININLINTLIDEYLASEDLHFVYKRNNSGTYKRTEIITIIENLLGQVEFQLWNMSMDRVIKFDEIGVLLLGRKKLL